MVFGMFRTDSNDWIGMAMIRVPGLIRHVVKRLSRPSIKCSTNNNRVLKMKLAPVQALFSFEVSDGETF